METLFELTFQDQTLTPQVGTFTDTSQTTGTFTQEDGEYYLTNGDTKGFYAYKPVAMQSGLVDDSKVIIEFDLKVVTASVNNHAIIGTYAGVDGNGIPTGDKITLQYNAGDIELVLGSGTTATLIEAADVVVDQWYHFRIDCMLAAPLASTYQVKIDGVSVTTVTGAAADYELGIIGVLGTDLHACDECGIKNITLVTETNMFVGRTALEQALQDVKGYVDTTKIPLAGSNAISGSLIPATTDAYDLGGPSYQWNNAYIKSLTINGVACGNILTHNASEFVPRSGGAVMSSTALGRTVNDSEFRLDGGTGWNDGASLSLSGKDRPGSPALATLHTSDGTATSDLLLRPNGIFTLVTNGTTKYVAMQEDVIPRSGGAVITGRKIARTDATKEMNYCGGTSQDDGATLILVGKNASSNMGSACIKPSDGTNSRFNWMRPDGTWTWNGTACQIISDQRLKQQITEIDDKLLDAWEDVNLVQFKYNDAVGTKKDKARLHTGYVVQQIDKACQEHGVDISAYGLYCHEEYPQETEEVEVEQKDGTKVKETKVIREASEHYSLRYTEALVVECKYLRRCIARLTARIEQLEKEQEASK